MCALLEHGATPLCRDVRGRTPLHLAASRGHRELLGLMLAAALHADPLDSLLDYSGYTPSHWAAYHGEHDQPAPPPHAGGGAGGDSGTSGLGLSVLVSNIAVFCEVLTKKPRHSVE